MARHPLGTRAGQKARNPIYAIVVVVLLIGAAITFYYGPFSRNEAEPTDVDLLSDVNTARAAAPDANEIVTLVSPTEIPESDMSEPNVVGLEPNLPEYGVESIPPSDRVQEVHDTTAIETVVQPGDEATALIAEAETLMSKGSSGIVAAREKLNEALRMPMSEQQRSSVKNRLSKLSDQWLFSRTVLPNDTLCESYMVRSRDRLAAIGDKYKVPYEILMRVNNITDPRTLQAGATIKVMKGPFHAKVYRSTFTMDLYVQNTYVRSFSVGLGKPGHETPTGLWRVRPGGKAYATSWRDPDTGIVYQPEDPDYPLGSRWIALDGLSGEAKGRTGFGIHGTKEPDQIGKADSRGCIRMFNGEVIQVYNMLVEGLSQVEVAD